jgi:hypothetical protein
MATTTPNYGWDVPTSTDYVKDGATAIETLGDDIDASLFGITNGKNVGLVPLNTTSFTAQTAVTIDNVFSATYANYIIETKFTQNTAAGDHQMYLRAGGVDAAGNWRGGGVFNYATSATLSSYRMNGGAGFQMGGGAASSAVPAATFKLFNPFVAANTQVFGSGVGNDATAIFSWNLNANHDISTAYDGIKFLCTAGTITGTIRIYGIRNS